MSVAGTISMQDGVLVFAQSITCHAWNGDHTSKIFGIFFFFLSLLTSLQKSLFPQTLPPSRFTKRTEAIGKLKMYYKSMTKLWPALLGQWTPILFWHVLMIEMRTYGPTKMGNGSQLSWFCVSPELLLKWNGAHKVLSSDFPPFLCSFLSLENKFAVASGAKCVSICYYEEDNDWWVSKHIKKHDSTVTSVDWHPGNVLIATGSCDSKVRVFSAFIKGIDKRPENTPYGKRLPFGQDPLCEYQAGGWVQSVRWAPSGNQLAYAAQNSTLTIVDVTNGAPGEIQVVKFSDLPLMDIFWVGENKIIGAGHGCKPLVFENQGGTWYGNLVWYFDLYADFFLKGLLWNLWMRTKVLQVMGSELHFLFSKTKST
jgi:WD40 repeat protein